MAKSGEFQQKKKKIKKKKKNQAKKSTDILAQRYVLTFLDEMTFLFPKTA